MSLKRSQGGVSGLGSTPAVIIAAAMYKNAEQLGLQGSSQKVTFQVERYDTDGGIVDLTNNRLVAPIDGLYQVGGQLDVVNATTAYQEITLRKNGSAIFWIFRGAQNAISEFRPWMMNVVLAADDYLEIWAELPNSTYEQIQPPSSLELFYLGSVA